MKALKAFPGNKLRNNYVIFRYFLLQTNVTKKLPFYNVISVRNSYVIRNFNVIKKRNYIEQINNVTKT